MAKIERDNSRKNKNVIFPFLEENLDLENPQNYKPYLDEIRSWFPKVEITNTKDLLVHVRVGDNGPNIYTPFEWYKRAIEDNNIEFAKALEENDLLVGNTEPVSRFLHISER